MSADAGHVPLTYPKPPAIPPPYYHEQSGNNLACRLKSGLEHPPFLIGVAGGGASGKSEVCELIMKGLLVLDEKDKPASPCPQPSSKMTLQDRPHTPIVAPHLKVVTISMSDFYKELTPDLLDVAARGLYNFDSPDAFDFELLEHTLDRLNEGLAVEIPQFDFKTYTRLKQTTLIQDPHVVIIEGILILYSKRVRESLSLKVFIDVDDDDRLARHMTKNMLVYHKNVDDILNHYLRCVKPSFEDYILPTKKFADVMIPRGHANWVAIDLLVHHIRDIIQERNAKLASGISSTSPHREQRWLASWASPSSPLNESTLHYGQMMK